jgi:hypothetical protein
MEIAINSTNVASSLQTSDENLHTKIDSARDTTHATRPHNDTRAACRCVYITWEASLQTGPAEASIPMCIHPKGIRYKMKCSIIESCIRPEA